LFIFVLSGGEQKLNEKSCGNYGSGVEKRGVAGKKNFAPTVPYQHCLLANLSCDRTTLEVVACGKQRLL
jgi:hypothetical protein